MGEIKELIKIETNDKELRITSVELVDIINQFRELESRTTGKKYIKLVHKDFMKKIRKELETLKTLGLSNERNISPVNYLDQKGESRPCYSFNRDGMLQMLNSESVLVRYKTTEYINKLELQLQSMQPKLPSYAEALRQLADSIEENEKLKVENGQQKQLIGEMRPKVEYVDTILKSKDTVTVTQIAKDYGMSAQELNKILNEEKIQYCQSGQWLLYARYQDKGYTKSNTVTYKHGDGSVGSKLNTRWTQKGRLFINDILRKNGIVALMDREYEQVN